MVMEQVTFHHLQKSELQLNENVYFQILVLVDAVDIGEGEVSDEAGINWPKPHRLAS